MHVLSGRPEPGSCPLDLSDVELRAVLYGSHPVLRECVRRLACESRQESASRFASALPSDAGASAQRTRRPGASVPEPDLGELDRGA